MKLISTVFVTALLFLAGSSGLVWGRSSTADAATSIEGHWEGAINTPGPKLAIDVDLSRKGDEWSGDISIPAQMARDMPLGRIAVEGANVTWQIPGIPGDPTFVGMLSEDGTRLSGKFTQGGADLTFELSRKARPETMAADALAGLDEFLDQARRDWKVPGMAVGVVKGDEVIYARGVGFRDVEAKKPVTLKTLFAIGSTTKAFTTFVMGTLVDEGRLEWDKRLTSYWPTFRMYDKTAGELMTPRDLVTHRCGLPRHDLLWYNSTITLQELVERLPFLENSKPFRETFQYNNLMFGAAGHVIEQITGASWEQSVQRRILDPLGMSRTNFSVRDSQKSDDFSLPYEEREHVVKVMSFRDITNVGPAGSINSCIDDMTAWLRVHLNQGQWKGKALLNAATMRDIHSTHMVIDDPGIEPEVVVHGYALGWMTSTYRGRQVISHGGGIDGFITEVSMIPSERIGLVVFANLNGTPLPGLVERHVFDRLIGAEPKDWNGEALARRVQSETARDDAKEKRDLARKSNTRPAHELADYAGDYEHPGYGNMRIAVRGEQLEMTYNRIVVPLEHWHFEVFAGKEVAGDNTFENHRLMFVTNLDGEVSAIQSTMEPLVKPIEFVRLPDKELRDPKYLAKFVGEYELPPQLLKISLRGSALLADVQGQPTYELEPNRNDSFNLKGIAGFSAKFVTDESGSVIELRVIQPDGVFAFKPR